MARELVDRRDRLFGREGDLAYLLERARFKGLTAVVARPQMGKSWLLTELARRLAQEHEPRYLVGFAESLGETPDLLLRTVVDLYARWLSDAGLWQQANKVWENEKPNLLPGVAKAVAKIFKETNPATKPVAMAVEEAINGLLAADERLRTGGLQLPMLSYEQARDLVRSVADISGRPIALLLDQWEKSPDAPRESKTLDAFLHHLDDWPSCHVFMALRPDEPAHVEVEKLANSVPGPAKLYPLEGMNLDAESEQLRLVGYIRDTVPAADDVDAGFLLDRIDRFPGVIGRWITSTEYERERMRTRADLARVAVEAFAYRYSELQERLKKLEADQRRLAIRLALLPLGGGPVWDAIRGEVLRELDAGLIDDLRITGVLESGDPPSFGHSKRWEAARDWFFANRRNSIRSEAKGLIDTVAAPIQEVTLGVLPNVLVLVGLLPAARELELDVVSQALCQAAASVSGDSDVLGDALIRGAKQVKLAESGPGVPLLAIGLFNARNAAKTVDDLALRDLLLEELRGLAEAYPEYAAVRRPLAMALLNTLIDAKAEDDRARRDTLLEELRGLSAAHPQDAAVRNLLARGVFSTLNDSEAEDDRARRDALLEELRDLTNAHPEDPAVRENLAKGLFNTLNDAKAENDFARCDGLLAELRELAGAHPEDAAVREWLGKGLFNTLNDAKTEYPLPQRDGLLEELRRLAKANPEDGSMRQLLSMGLLNILKNSETEDDLARHDAPLQELWQLTDAHPEDAAVRERLAAGLFITWTNAKTKGDLARRDAALVELRSLTQTYPDDWVSRVLLVITLANMLEAGDGQAAQRDGLLEELRDLAEADPEDEVVRRLLAISLRDPKD